MDVGSRNLEARNMDSSLPSKAFQKISYLHPWADESLIQDVLAGVNNNVDEALSLLESMLISENKNNNNRKEDMSGITSVSDDGNDKESEDQTSLNLLLGAAKSISIEPEPEWDEDDVYLFHGKDAMRMMSQNHPMWGNRGKAKITSDWMDFDLKQRREQQALESDNDLEPYPVLPEAPRINEILFKKNDAPLEKLFSSVVPAMNFPSLMDVGSRNLEARNMDSSLPSKAFQKISYLHPWADESLIQDVLAGVNNNVDEALSLLESMLISENKNNNNRKEDMSGITSVRDDGNDKESEDQTALNLLLGAAKSIPIEPEPEWDEDDVYLFHHKDAMRIMSQNHPMRGNTGKAKITSVWTDFDLKQRRKQQGLESDNDLEPYQVLSEVPRINEILFKKNDAPLEQPLSSVVVPAMNFPSLMDVGSRNLEARNMDSSLPSKAFQKISYLHPWADESFILDVLAGVNNNVDEALSLLESMLISENKNNNSRKEDMSGITSVRDDGNDKESEDQTSLNLLLSAAKSIPIEPEPEWEEDDFYLFRHKDAMRMMRGKAKITSGWTDFDLKQRRKQQGLESDNDLEPYPVLSEAPRINGILFKKNDAPLEKLFSSVVPAMNFPSLMDVGSRNLGARNMDSSLPSKAFQKISYLHPWADESFIQDVLAVVNNNVDEALSLLESMLISENKNNHNRKEDMSGITSVRDDGNDKESEDQTSLNLLLGAAKSIPIDPEPEWEEDDVYLFHRKDAMRMMRSAAHHSKSARDAYLRGDHVCARHFSQKAKEERAVAEKLNAQAAKEILTLKNSKNDLWTLDLHGLHAAEAVEALRERLQIVESIMSTTNVVSRESGISSLPSMIHNTMEIFGRQQHLPGQRPQSLEVITDVVSTESGMSSLPSMIHNTMELFGRQQHLPGQRPKSLEVITGKGNHSRGAAALPPAIRNFLSQNGYHRDETRPGVIMVRPKFRPQ